MSRSLELLRQIGEGGHSVVFLARRYGQHGFQRLVAVKVVRRDSELPSTVGDRFLHEARLLGLLQHRGIVVADDVVELDRGTAIVMEYVPGLDLSDIMRLEGLQPGSVPLGWLAHVGLEVTTALHAALARPSPITGAPLRVMHLDVKPSNIRVTPDGTTKLLDFGVSTSSIDTTASGPMMGTVSYAAPERIAEGITAPSSDLFSLGLTLLAVARGRPMRGRPIRSEAFEEWFQSTLRNLSPAFEPLLPLIARMSSLHLEDRPTHTEARDEFFEIFRRHARRPPADVSEELCARVAACRTSDPSDATVSDLVGAFSNAFGSASGERAATDATELERVLRTISGEVLPTPPPLPGEDLADGTITSGEATHHSEALTVDETFVFQLNSASLENGADDDLLRLHATWFSGAASKPAIRGADQPLEEPPVMLLANLGSFRQWLPLDTAMAVLEADEAVGRFPGGVCGLLERMFLVGWLEPRRLGPVAAIRVATLRKGTAAHAWARLDRAEQARVLAVARSSMVAPYRDVRLLIDVAHGAGPGPTLARAVAEELFNSEAKRVEGLPAGVAAVLSVRAGGSRRRALETLSATLAQPDLSPTERQHATTCMAHIQLVDPWSSVADRRRGGWDRSDAPRDDGSESMGRWMDALWISTLRLAGRLQEAEASLDRAGLDAPSDALPTVRARLELERAQVMVRTGRREAARQSCERALKIAHFSFLDLVEVCAHCLQAERCLDADDAHGAGQHAEKAVASADAAGCPRSLAAALLVRGVTALVRRDLSAAGADLHRAVAIAPDEDVGLVTVVRAWTGGMLLVGGHPQSAHLLLSRLDPETDGLPAEVSVLVHAWKARTALVLRETTMPMQHLRRAWAAVELAGGSVLPSIRSVLEEAELVAGQTGVYLPVSRGGAPTALR